MIIEKYETVRKRQMLDCRVKAIMELLNGYDIALDSREIMILAESFVFQYGKISFSEANIYDIPYAVASINDVEKNVLKNMGIDYICERLDNSKQNWEKMKAILSSRNPILTKIDGRFVHESASTVPKKIINIHYLSSVLLVGYDEGEENVFIILTNSNEIDKPQKCSYATFQKYRGTKCFPFGPEFLCFYVNNIQEGNLEIRKLIIKSLRRICENMLISKDIKIDIEEFECNKLITGIAALKNLQLDLSEKYKKYKRKQISSKEIIFILLFLRNNLMYGSYSAYREEFSRAIDYLGGKYQIIEINDVSKCIFSSSKYWKKIFVNIAKISHQKKIKRVKILKILLWLKKIVQLEEKAFKRLEQILNKETN